MTNIRISKAFITVSNEALCVLTGIEPVGIELKEVVKNTNWKETGM